MNARPAARRSSLAGTSPVQPASPQPLPPEHHQPPSPSQPETKSQPSRKPTKATNASNSGNRSGGGSPYRHKVSFYQDRAQTDRVRGAILHTMAAEGGRTLSDFIANAVMAEVERLEAKYNNGEPFPSLAAGELPQGRPMGRGPRDTSAS